MAVGVLRNFWRYLFADVQHPCGVCKSKDSTIEILNAQLEFANEQVKKYEGIVFRQRESRTNAPVGGFESLGKRRARLEREARLKANGTMESKGWKNLDELEAEVKQ
jgi:hypothetical protein